MGNTLVEKSNILKIKSKFFLNRALTYSSFLLLPVWIQKSLELHPIMQLLLMTFYITFMAGQWFLLGKEIDHRFKIYFRINSSIDRIIYRLFLGMFCMTIYFNIINLFPTKWTYNFFWITWILLGIYYSWPTRGKIIHESVTTSFGEFRYLDAFEKTVLFLIIGFLIISFPNLPQFTEKGTLILFFDPLEKVSQFYWNFLNVNYFPFRRYPELFRLAWCSHFYLVNIGLFLATLYAFLRYFVSRRLSLLGVFALISSWSFSKIFSSDYGASLGTTYLLFWLWGIFWITKSSSYRVGLFLGLSAMWAVLINQSYFILGFGQLLLLYSFFLGHKTKWFRRKFLRYTVLGFSLAILAMIFSDGSFENIRPVTFKILKSMMRMIEGKAFFALAIVGIVLFFWRSIWGQRHSKGDLSIDSRRALVIITLVILVYSLVIDGGLVYKFGMMWILTLLSLLPLEFLFQNISRFRSKRNMIFLTYVLICLLDSHMEGRIKIFLRLIGS